MTEHIGCPVVEGFEPLDQHFLADPFSVMNPAIREHPVFFYPTLGLWCVAGYQDIQRVIGDVETFSSNASALMPVPPEVAHRISADFWADATIAMDPPRHTISRKNINKAFTRGRVLELEPRIERIAHELIDGFEGDGHADLMLQYCNALSLRVMLELLGFPADDLGKFLQWAEDVMTLLSPRAQMPEEGYDGPVKPLPHQERVDRWGRVADEREYLRAAVEQRLEHPTDDLTSALAHAVGDDGAPAMSTEQVVTHVMELLTAGTDTTASLIGHIVMLLSRHPQQLDQLLERPELWAAAVDEGLRRRGSSLGMFRKATRDADLGGVTIPAGALVFVLSGTSGYDEQEFPDAGRFDIHRSNASSHLSFGKGRHFCLGAPLARSEARIALQALYSRLPTLRAPEQDVEFIEALQVFLLRHLQVDWRLA
jgi:cytochrome P450